MSAREPVVLVERRGDVTVATINRPHRRNAADLAVYHRLEEALRADAAACVITGAGGDFSAGDDVGIFDFADRAQADRFIAEVTRIFELIETLERPVVAAVDGYALGFGFELALVSDAVVATERARLGLPEIVHGAAPPNAIGRGPDVLGRGLVRHLALRGRRWLSGTEAHRWGMVVELQPPAELVDAAVALAGDLAADPGFVAAKRLRNVDGGRAFRLAPMVMPRLMVSDAIATARARYARD